MNNYNVAYAPLAYENLKFEFKKMEKLQNEFIQRRMQEEHAEKSENEIIEELNNEEVVRLIPLIIFLLIIALTGLPGNGLVCYIYRSKYRMSSSRWFIFFLAAVDLILCAIIIPGEIITTVMQYNFTSGFLCKVTVFFNLWSLLSLGLTLVIVSVDRYRKVCKPIGWQINFRKARILSVIAVIVAFVLSLPVWGVYGINKFEFVGYNVTASECGFRQNSDESMMPFVYVMLGMLLFTGALATICILYCFIGAEIKQHIRRENIKRHISLSASMVRKHNKVNINAVANNVDMNVNIKRVKFLDDSPKPKRSVRFNPPPIEQPEPSVDDTDTEISTNMSEEETADFEAPVIPAIHMRKTKSKRLRKAKARKATFSMFLISIAFVLSYLPFLCLLLARSVVTDIDETLSDGGRAVYKFFLRSYFLNCAINPFIYGISDSSFRESCKEVLYSIYARLCKACRFKKGTMV